MAKVDIWESHPPSECPVVDICGELRHVIISVSSLVGGGLIFAIKSRTKVQQEFIWGVNLFLTTPSMSASKSLLLSVPTSLNQCIMITDKITNFFGEISFVPL